MKVTGTEKSRCWVFSLRTICYQGKMSMKIMDSWVFSIVTVKVFSDIFISFQLFSYKTIYMYTWLHFHILNVECNEAFFKKGLKLK